MMAQVMPFIVIVAALLISMLSYCSAENVYCVTPTATSCSSCPQNSTNCTTLSEYAREAELYFTSNTTMVFLPGDHTLDTNITVANVSSLIMNGESSSGTDRATVVCSGSVGLSFTSMVDFKIDSLAFTSCSRKYAIIVVDFVYAALYLQSTQHTELVNCSFHDNMVTALVVNNTNITLSGNTEFTHNRACGNSAVGGGIIASDSSLTFTGNTTFLDNSAVFGGAIFTLNNTVLSFCGSNNFINNLARSYGGAISTSPNTVLRFNGITHFINNSAYYGGAIFISNSTLTFNGAIYFSNNGYYGGAVDGITIGGGVFMGPKSNFSILPNTTVCWENNHARLGGAIYAYDVSPKSYCIVLAPYVPKEECFFQLPGQNLSNDIDVQLVFKNNSAAAGSVLYGGVIDNCKLTYGLDSYSSGEVFDMIVHIDNDNTNSNISSHPLQVCLCENNLYCSGSHYPIPSIYTYPRTLYPGETFQVLVVAVGQRDGTVPSTVRSSIDNTQYPGTKLQDYQYLQQAKSNCTEFNYTVFSLLQTVSIELVAEGTPCSFIIIGGFFALQISVHLNQTCPPGFNISESAGSCVCEPRLEHYTNNCTITNGIGNITREAGQQFWVGYDNQSHSDELILHPLCPYSYCVNDNVSFPLNESDIQCANNRSGLLCGACKEEHSLVLGTSQCWKCTNSHLVLLIPFAVMGVALVFFLLVCKLTVATGTLSGLVFYANIVGVNRTIFVPVDSTDALSVFIAWLNLDFGIETCFYDGMDTYSKTWLQFVFPVYIWFLVGLVILVSHFSRRFAKLLGNNPVSVLATLILLSYTKILRTLITAIHITYLEYPTYNRGVWLLDANIDYLSGKHIPLFIVALLVLLFLFLPYTLLLVFGQWLQAISHLRLFSWVKSVRLKPFMDSYHAPYKAKHRYWPGLLLVLRCVLLLVLALNPNQDTSINLLAILVGTGILVAWAWVSGGVYRNWCLDALECSFALNLIILVGATYHVHRSGGNQLAVGYTSITITLATFIGILTYHTFQQLRSTKLWKKVPKLNMEFNRQNVKQAANKSANKSADKLPVETDFSRLREPLLEDLPQPNYGAF